MQGNRSFWDSLASFSLSTRRDLQFDAALAYPYHLTAAHFSFYFLFKNLFNWRMISLLFLNEERSLELSFWLWSEGVVVTA